MKEPRVQDTKTDYMCVGVRMGVLETNTWIEKSWENMHPVENIVR